MKLKPNSRLILMAILPVLLFSCEERYWPDLGDKYDQLLVVDGMMSNQPGPYTIRLSYSLLLQYYKEKPVTGCTLIISDQSGYSEILSETEPGTYITTDPDFQGVTGRKYKLTIHAPNEQTYESAFQELKEPVGIDTVYAKLEYKPNPDNDYDLAGFQFYVGTEAAIDDTNYYYWRLEQTYKFNPNYRIRYIFDGKMNPVSFPTPFYTCWKTTTVSEIFTYNTINTNASVIHDLPLNYVSTETKELSIKYSMLVKQFTLTREAYLYWNALQEQGAGQGSLYDKQPFQIRGNVFNVNQPDEAVLGYFLVAGSDEKRIFVDKPTGIDFHYSINCGMVTDDLMRMLYSIRHKWPVFLTILYEGEGSSGVIALPSDPICVDCREGGGDTEEPDFWEE